MNSQKNIEHEFAISFERLLLIAMSKTLFEAYVIKIGLSETAAIALYH